MITWDDFDKIWASTSPLTPYSFSDPNYAQGWNFVGSTPPARQMWDSIQKQNDEKFKYLRDNFGTPNIVTQTSQMTDTDKVYVYLGSEAGWNSGHWYYYDEGTSSWADGGVYNSVAFVTDTTLSIAGQPADAKATGDALALKSDLAGCTFTGNVSVNADLSVTGDASIGTDLSVAGTSTLTGNITAGGDIVATGDVSADNLTISNDATIGGDLSVTGTTSLTGNVTADNISATTNGTIGGALSVAGASTLTGNVSAGADITVVGDVSSANITASNNATIGGNATVTGSVASASLTTTADGTIGGNLSVGGTTILTGDVSASADLSVAGDSSLTNLSVSGTTVLAGTSTAPTPSADDNSTKIATTEYVQTELKPIEVNADITDKRISNIEKLLQGNLYDYQTDTDSKYVKSVPSGAMPYASLDSIGGKTLVWNQLVTSGDFTNVNDWNVQLGTKSVSNNEFTYTISSVGTNYFSNQVYQGVPHVPTDHVIFIHAETYTPYSNGFYMSMRTNAAGQTGVGISNVTPTPNTWNEFSKVSRTTNTLTDIAFYWSMNTNYNVGDSVKLRNCFVIDLTLMFGAGNEPSTVEEFESMFPASYYPYNAGTLLSAGVTEVVSEGVNVMPVTEVKTITVNGVTETIYPDGTLTIMGTSTFSGGRLNFIESFSLPAGNYRLQCAYLQTFLHKGTTILAQTTSSSAANFTLTETTTVSIGFNSVKDTTYNFTGKIQVVRGSANKDYTPYKAPISYPIPAEIQALEGYGWSAGSVYNYIDYEAKKFVKRVASVDLGSLTWIYDSGNPRFITTGLVSSIKPPSVTTETPNALCVPYITHSFSGATNGNIAFTTGGNTVVWDSAYTDATTFTNAMSGVYLYYELATPIETDISAYITDDNLIEVEAGGTLTFPNSNGTDYQIPVPSAETYMVDLQSAL